MNPNETVVVDVDVGADEVGVPVGDLEVVRRERLAFGRQLDPGVGDRDMGPVVEDEGVADRDVGHPDLSGFKRV